MSSIALDVGGTFIKAARIEGGSVQGTVVRRPVPAFLAAENDSGARELSPHELDAAVFAALRELGVDDPRAHDVYVSGQMAGLAFIDPEGRAVDNIISWQDTRYTRVDSLIQKIGHEAVSDLGDGLRIGSPAVTLAERGVPTEAHPTSLIAYVAGRLAGRRAERIHATDAGAWGLFDTRGMQWSRAACAAVGVDVTSLPNVVRDVETITAGTRVFTAIGDQQAALYGAGLAENQVSVNLATGCQVSILAREFSTATQTRPYFDTRYLNTVTHLPAGRLLAAAVLETYGDLTETTWTRAADEYRNNRHIATAVDAIAQEVATAVDRLGARGQRVLFSGGLVQRFDPIRDAILALLGNPEFRTFGGDDAAVAGLARIKSKRG